MKKSYLLEIIREEIAAILNELTVVDKKTLPTEAPEIAKSENTDINTVKDAIAQAKKSGKPVNVAEDQLNEDLLMEGPFIEGPLDFAYIDGKVEKGMFIGEGIKVAVPEEKLALLKENGKLNSDVVLGVRPENIHDDAVLKEKFASATVKLKVDVAELLGAETHIHAMIGDHTLTAKVSARTDINIGDDVELAFDMNSVHFFDPESELRLKSNS